MATPARPARKAPVKKAAAAKPTPAPAETEADGGEELTLLDKAAAALAEVGLGLSDVLAELIPSEAKETELVRKPLRPSLNVIKKTPVSVVMLEWDKAFSTEIDRPIDRDCQPFDDIDKALDYFNIQVRWAKSDVKEFDTGSHLVVLFKDTTDFSDRQVEVISGDAAWAALVQERLDNDDIDFLFSGKAKPSTAKATTGKAPAKKADVATRKPSAAAAKVKGTKDAPSRADDLNARLKESRERRAAKKAEDAADDAPVEKATNPVKAKGPRRNVPRTAPAEKKELSAVGFVGISRRSAKRNVRSA